MPLSLLTILNSAWKPKKYVEFVFLVRNKEISNLSFHVNVQVHFNMYIKTVIICGLNIYMTDSSQKKTKTEWKVTVSSVKSVKH